MCTDIRSSENYSVSADLETFAVTALLVSNCRRSFLAGVAKAIETTCFCELKSLRKLPKSIFGLIAVETVKERRILLSKSPDRSVESETR
jgi:hypothetical protein